MSFARTSSIAACALTCALGAAAISGCALLGKSDLVVPRYFTPMGATGSAAPAPAPQTELQLRIGRIEGLSHLRERMVIRTSPEELVYYEDRRWTERPEIYVRRALSQALFTERGVVEVVSGTGVTLEVELVAFEEIQKPHLARMEAAVTLRDGRFAALEETVTVEQPIADASGSDQPIALVEALSAALHKGTEQIADHVVTKLTALKQAR